MIDACSFRFIPNLATLSQGLSTTATKSLLASHLNLLLALHLSIMVFLKPVFFAIASLVALTTNAAPLDKRIAQVISNSTQQWVQACTTAGGADKCGVTSQTAFMTLLAGAGGCDQQNVADAMINLAKTLKNDAKMISLMMVFAQHPRNSLYKLSECVPLRE